jgi:hypothetical protein
MPTEYPVRISGPADAPPETAAIRLIALLPAGWRATLVGCRDTVAELAVSAPDGLTPAAVERALDEIVANPALRGWSRA